MSNREQLINNLQTSFEALHAERDDESTVVLLLNTKEKGAQLMASAPSANHVIHLQTMAITNQITSLQASPEELETFKEATVTAFIGMLGIDVTDEFLDRVKKTIEETEKEIADSNVPDAPIQ